MESCYVGLMSGSSMDGIDSVLVSFHQENHARVLASEYTPYSDNTRNKLGELLKSPVRESELAWELETELGQLYAQSIQNLMDGREISEINAVGCHGQTILHSPETKPSFSWQLGDASIVANQTGLPVVSNFREADMLVGGQGAPLAPAFHQVVFRSRDKARAIVNIGGISNVTYLPSNESDKTIGFDTGPGNVLCDAWTFMHKGQRYDADGQWALSSEPNEELLDALMSAPYFSRPIPKSLDTREFGVDWLLRQLDRLSLTLEQSEVQSTLAKFTAKSILFEIGARLPVVDEIYVCGGGAKNLAIMQHLRENSDVQVYETTKLGIPPDLVEACAFAWLAQRKIQNLPGNIPSVTGARSEVVLGEITYPQKNASTGRIRHWRKRIY